MPEPSFSDSSLKDSSNSASNDQFTSRLANFKVAVASTATRTLALYFSRPIRLFRPSKISGWHSLSGQSLPLLIRQKGWTVIPRHFLPPLVVNVLLGTVLWTTYSETTAALNSIMPSTSPSTIAAISGGCAGSVQALAAAPAENVRLVLEGGRARGSWSVAWKEVFAGTQPLSSSQTASRNDVRQVRDWVREVRGMAGRGWQGLGFGVAKDACAFSVFFAIFDVSRRFAARATAFSKRISDSMQTTKVTPTAKAHAARVVHSTAIVSGGLIAGLAYDVVCRPFDTARRYTIHHRATHAEQWTQTPHGIGITLATKIKEDGVLAFFQDPTRAAASSNSIHPWLRTLGRVGPWGVGFLVWENFGPAIV